MGKRLAGVCLAVALATPGVSAVIARPAAAATSPHLTVGDVRVNEGNAGKVNVEVRRATTRPSDA